jgi:uncharacterized protein (TIGR03067 family)
MRLLTLLVFAAGACAAAFAGGSTDANNRDLARMQGTWTLVSGEENGRKLSAEVRATGRLTIEGDQHILDVNEMFIEGTHKINAAVTPKTIDSTDLAGPFKGRVLRGIYQLTDNEFTVCFAAHGKERPKDFTAKAGSGNFIHRWQRQDAAAAE